MKRRLSLSALSIGLALAFSGSGATAATLAHRYSFNDPAGSTSFTNSVASGVDGMIYKDNVVTEVGAWLDGSQLQIIGLADYAILPGGMISTFPSVTIEFWGSLYDSNAFWTRVWAFGDQTPEGNKASGLDYCHYAGGDWQNLDISSPSGGAYANNPGGLNNQNNVHVTCVIDPAGNQMYYYNGTTVLSSLNGGQVPALSGIADTYGLLGKSLFNIDPILAGSIDEFRIYNGALSRAQVALNDAAGPDTYLTNPGTLISVQLQSLDNPLSINQVSKQAFKGNFTQVSGLDLAAYGGASFTSENTDVFTVNSEGFVTAIAPGTANIVASYGGMSVTNSLTVQAVPAVLKHRYSFDADASDSVSTADGTLENGASISGGKVILAGGFSGQHVSLPGPTINVPSYASVTIEAWVDFGDVPTWSRLWNFGNSVSGGGVNEIYFAPRVLTGGEHWLSQNIGGGRTTGWNKAYRNMSAHLTFIMDPPSGLMAVYKDGVLEYARYDATASLSQVSSALAVLGRSLVDADQYMPGSIDEFRIYSGALTPPQIALNHANGPASTALEVGDLQSITVADTVYPANANRMPPVILANYANLTGFNLLPNNSARVQGLTIQSSDPSIIEVLDNDMIRTYGPGQVTLTATYFNQTHSAQVTVGNKGELTHRYSFNDNVNDLVGTAHGTLHGSASLSGGKLVLVDAADTFLELPGGLVTDYEGITIDTWADLGAVGHWARLWFFGNFRDGEFYVAPRAGDLNHRLSTGFSFGIGNTTMEPPGSWQSQSIHLTVVYGHGTMATYTNGVLEAVATTTGRPDQIGQEFCWLGQSPWLDPHLDASIDEFRIYNGRLSPQEIHAAHVLGPDALLSIAPPTLTVNMAAGSITLEWPIAAAGFILQATDDLAEGGWTIITNAPTLVGSEWRVTLPASSGSRYFRLWR